MPALEAARAGVHLAATVVQWFVSGAAVRIRYGDGQLALWVTNLAEHGAERGPRMVGLDDGIPG
ncbi:hypothetical protein [Streptomyces sp. NBC_00829]|uniref:hypothetical protein n=1 Tax=Streptomyces sp. NBC_00829 TaxID=2903679 RepID=UPI00386ED551|nr:hypothetical protein OG293_37765 [Streptomyces sp. NBC_00829]